MTINNPYGKQIPEGAKVQMYSPADMTINGKHCYVKKIFSSQVANILTELDLLRGKNFEKNITNRNEGNDTELISTLIDNFVPFSKYMCELQYLKFDRNIMAQKAIETGYINTHGIEILNNLGLLDRKIGDMLINKGNNDFIKIIPNLPKEVHSEMILYALELGLGSEVHEILYRNGAGYIGIAPNGEENFGAHDYGKDQIRLLDNEIAYEIVKCSAEIASVYLQFMDSFVDLDYKKLIICMIEGGNYHLVDNFHYKDWSFKQNFTDSINLEIYNELFVKCRGGEKNIEYINQLCKQL